MFIASKSGLVVGSPEDISEGLRSGSWAILVRWNVKKGSNTHCKDLFHEEPTASAIFPLECDYAAWEKTHTTGSLSSTAYRNWRIESKRDTFTTVSTRRFKRNRGFRKPQRRGVSSIRVMYYTASNYNIILGKG